VAERLRILAVADDAQVGRWLQHRAGTLRDACDVELDTLESFDLRLATTGTRDFHVLLAVLRFDAATAAQSLAWLERTLGIPDMPAVAVIAEDGDELTAVQCMRHGAVDYLPRRLINAERLNAALEHRRNPARRPSTASRTTGTQHPRRPASLPVNLKVPRDLIPRYMLLDTLGESARATVYLAMSSALNRHVALKVSHVTDGEEPQFSREYQTVGGIRHPAVVDIYDYGLHDGREFIAMEYFACGDLKARLQNPLSEHEALDYLRRIATALSFVHGQGILHRDLKPPNIMLREDGQIVLIDFGLAKNLDHGTRSTEAGVLRGSPYYMSPEQAQGLELDARSDLYSLGIIFCEMLTGTKPYLGATAVEVLQQHVSGPMPELPPELARHQALLEGMLAKSRDDRFPTADDLLACLDQAAA
jgi:ActR/RegA family two-component response regulator/predicted Ser/Thr protein kinase